MNEDIYREFLSFYEYHNLTPYSKTYSMFIDSSMNHLMSEFSTNGLIEIRETIVRMKGVSYNFTITELGQNILDFHQL